MFANAKALAVIVSCALVAHAQSSGSSTTATAPPSQPSAPGLDSCIIDCVSTAATDNGCVSFTNLTCTCTSTAFQNQASMCLQANCTATDIATVQQLQQQECGALNSSSTGSVPASTGSVPASTASSTTTSSATTGTHSATSSSAAMALSAPFSLGGIVSTLVASAGALVGAAFIL